MKLKSYKDDLLKELRDPEYASEYLAKALETGDQATFLLALRDVAEAGDRPPNYFAP
jgi:DNA-binding phage protein